LAGLARKNNCLTLEDATLIIIKDNIWFCFFFPFHAAGQQEAGG
jgi:hypothetical protein